MKTIVKIICFFVTFLGYSNTIPVGKSQAVKTIKQALAMANDGDTILVHHGHYKEGNIIITKKIAFIGKDFPTLDGESKYEILSVKADSVLVRGFKVINSGYASRRPVRNQGL